MSKEELELEQEQEVKLPSKEELLQSIEHTSNDDDDDDGDGGEGGPEYTAAEQEAIEKGWNPEGVEGKKNLSADEFLDRQSLYDDLHSLKRQNKRLQSDIENINKYQNSIREDERKKVIDELKSQKKDALNQEDYDRVIEIDEQLADARSAAKEEDAAAAPKVNEDFNEWVVDNSWYKEDADLRDEADTYGEAYWRRHPQKERAEVYDAVAQYIKRSYKEKFENTNRGKPDAVDSSVSVPRKPKAKSKLSAKDLPADQRSIMKTILRTTKMTEEEYLKDYFAMVSE